MKNRVITLSGELGAGKSTTTKLLMERLGYERLYTGGLHRQYAEELGLSFDEYHKLAEQDPKYDNHVDHLLQEFLNKGNDIICDSFMSPWLAPSSFKVFLDIDPRVAAERMFEDQKSNPDRATEDYGSVESQLEKNIERRTSNIKRFREYNGIENYLDKSHFDLIIDTTDTPPEQVVDQIEQAYKDWLAVE
jgi:predicted cytidylate kinase